MIAKLKGIVDSFGEDWVIIDVNGVGYQVFCSSRTLQNMDRVGEATTLFIETYVREDQLKLFGFASELEKQWYTLLTTVQGVGAKVCLAILTAASPDELAAAVAAQDKTTFTRASGVGPKVANRIVSELKDKVPASMAYGAATGAAGGAGGASDAAVEAALAGSVIEDVISALTNLGYRQADAAGAVARAAQKAGPDATFDTLIRDGLKELAG